MLYFGHQINIHTGHTTGEHNEDSAEEEIRDGQGLLPPHPVVYREIKWAPCIP